MASEEIAMTEAIKIAIITGGLAFLGTLISQWMSTNKLTNELYAKLDKQSELADEKIRGELNVIHSEISTLSAHVEKHNKMVERTYALETEVAKQGEQIKMLNKSA